MKGKVTILMFHRVTDSFFDVSLLIKRETFEECMKYVVQNHSVISLGFLAQNFDKWKKIPDGSYVITFDDGWIDFHDTAYPILSRLKIPATVYLTTGFVSSKCSYWQEQLNNLLIPILANKKMFLEKDNIISTPEIRLKLNNLISKSEDTQAVFKFIDYLKGFTQDIISKIISELEEFLKEHAIMIGEVDHRSFIRWDEVNSINEPEISFGSHTVSHPILTNEQTDVVEDEICRSKEIIEKETGRDVFHFCYPNGNYNDEIKKNVSGSYNSACTTNAGFVSKNSDIYALNRIGINEEMVTDWRGNFSKYVFTLSLFLESIRK
ncbi:MAG: polysaccharide deacetylase family protein [Candidatus Scalindua sp.]|nr:polysaccharide deacetylase family protein [Candidatus Scalindua sp.]